MHLRCRILMPDNFGFFLPSPFFYRAGIRFFSRQRRKKVLEKHPMTDKKMDEIFLFSYRILYRAGCNKMASTDDKIVRFRIKMWKVKKFILKLYKVNGWTDRAEIVTECSAHAWVVHHVICARSDDSELSAKTVERSPQYLTISIWRHSIILIQNVLKKCIFPKNSSSSWILHNQKSSAVGGQKKVVWIPKSSAVGAKSSAVDGIFSVVFRVRLGK